jgi:hypothetical protein
VRFPLFQLAVVVAVILFLQAGDDKSARGQMFNGLDELVESTVGLFSAVFNVKSFTKSWLTTGFWIAYVYLASAKPRSLGHDALQIRSSKRFA